MPGLWGSCFRCKKREGQAVEERVVVSARELARSSNGTKYDVEEAGDTVAVPKWEEAFNGPDPIMKPKPVRVHLRRPSSMGLGYKVGLVYDDRMRDHFNVEDPLHPESSDRISAIYETLEAAGVLEMCDRVEAREASVAELSCVHGKKHIDNMRAVSKQSRDESSRRKLSKKYNSMFFNEGSSKAALLAAGSCVEIALKVAKGELGAGAAVIRPPGHHAESDAPMGTCIFNNVAIAAHYVVHCQPVLGIEKVLIVDWDVHHGNATQNMFWQDPFVLYFSIHRYDNGLFYPASKDGDSDKIGEGAGKGFNVNVPLQSKGYGDLDYLAVFDHLLIPIAQQFNPDMVFISGGFDSARGDPFGGCELTPAGYFQMTQRLMGLAGGRVVLALEGGYNLQSISESYLACMKALLGESVEEKVSLELRSSTWSLIKDVRQQLLPYWSSLAKILPEHPPEHFDVAEDEGLDSAYQDSVSVSEEESDDELDEFSKNEEAEAWTATGLDVDDQPGDLLTQMRTLEEEARRSSVQLADVDGLVDRISNFSVKAGAQNLDVQPVHPLMSWEKLLDETVSKNFRITDEAPA